MRLQSFLDISQATNMSTLERRLIDVVHEMDFALVSAALVIAKPGAKPQFVTVGNTPSAFKEASLSPANARRDPVIQQLKTSSTPFTYDQDLYVKSAVADLWEEQAPFGYRTGISVALHLPGDKHFLLGVDREAPLPQKDEELTKMLAHVQLLAVYAQDAALRLFATEAEFGEAPKLTPREVEVMRWTMEGKSSWAIGEILGTSEHTVNFHIANFRRKLGSTSRHQAVLKALSLGLI